MVNVGGGSWLMIVFMTVLGPLAEVLEGGVGCGHGSTADHYVKKLIQVCTSHGA